MAASKNEEIQNVSVPEKPPKMDSGNAIFFTNSSHRYIVYNFYGLSQIIGWDVIFLQMILYIICVYIALSNATDNWFIPVLYKVGITNQYNRSIVFVSTIIVMSSTIWY